eukprot:132925_1
MKISGNTFFVTGAGSGLGKAAAEWLANEGANVTLYDLNGTAVSEVVANLKGKLLAIQGDVTEEKQVQDALDQTVQEFGTLNGVINCAGIVIPTPIVGTEGEVLTPLDTFRKHMDVNVVGTFNVIRLATAIMSKNDTMEGGERGVIINTGSITAFDAATTLSAYSASKGAISGSTLVLAHELGEHGIRVVTVAPGMMDTPMNDQFRAGVEELIKYNKIAFPKRMGEPKEFASLCAEIVRNKYLNGTTIRMDGGLHI